MDVARPKYISKVRSVRPIPRCFEQCQRMLRNLIGQCVRNTSCSSGWLRLMLQSIFAVITVSSFILIVIMSVKNPTPGIVVNPMVQMRCHLLSCRVVCNKAPYYEDFEDDILYAVMDAENQCGRVYLELHEPAFTNATLPCNWLATIRSDISQLAIFGGNLMHIPSGAFMSQFAGSVLTLQLLDLRLKTFEPNSLVGLSKLRTLNILYSWLDDVDSNVLRAVDDTLETLTIVGSGDWDPVVFTGFRGLEKLTIVDFSYNNFKHVLNKQSFVGLDVTKILYLNSCKIISIGPGTFDHLTSIEVLYLNDNMLTTVPAGLFNEIISLDNPRPRIHLQDNYWHCDCMVDDLRQLVRKEILLVEAKCFSPHQFRYMTLSEFDSVCTNNFTDNHFNNSSENINSEETINSQGDQRFYTESVYVNRSSCENVVSSLSALMFQVVPAVPNNNVCTSKKFKYLNLSSVIDRKQGLHINNKWIQFSYFVTTDSYSVVQISALSDQNKFGLIWYQHDCRQKIYCLDVLPNNLKVYNTDPNARYTFCPVYLKNVSIEDNECFEVSARKTETNQYDNIAMRSALYLGSMVLCCCLGATAAYSLIRKKPTLLKGSKRIVFVKHKNFDALVMPPKLPLRDDLIDSKDNEVFTLTKSNNDKFNTPNVQRMKSVRSDKSGSSNYISVIQPTEDQLAEWRIKHHFNNDLTISSLKSEVSTLSWIDTTYYYSLEDGDRTYESLK